MDAEIVAAHEAIDQQAILRLDQRIDALEELLRSANEQMSSHLTPEHLNSALQTLRDELAAAREAATAEAQVADAEARVAEAEAAEAEALETVALLEQEQLQVLEEEPEVSVEEVTVEETSPEEEGSSTTTTRHQNGLKDFGIR